MKLLYALAFIMTMTNIVFCSSEASLSSTSGNNPNFLDKSDNQKLAEDSTRRNEVNKDLSLLNLYYEDLANVLQNSDSPTAISNLQESDENTGPTNSYKRQFSPWGGKRSQKEVNIPVQTEFKRDGFNAWGGKRDFNAWGGKRDFNSWGGKRDFNAWGGKRSQSFHEIQQPDPLERSDASLECWKDLDDVPDSKILIRERNFNAWGGKRNLNAWGGKRNFNVWRGKRNFNAGGGKRNFNSWEGKKNFNSWGGKRNFNAWGGKRNFNAWGGKRNSNSCNRR